jgi:hypothetical protein
LSLADRDWAEPGGNGFFDQWFPVARVAGVECPATEVNHADLGSFDWQLRPILSGEVANFAVSLSSPNVVYMGIEENAHSVHRSDDFGETWTVLHRFDHAKDAAVHPTDPDIAFHADSSGVWRTSTRLPESYTRVLRGGSIGPPQAAFTTVVISPSDPEVVYTAQKGDDDPNGILDGGVVYRSTDGGRSFSRMARRTPVVNVLAVDPGNTDRLLLGSSVGIHESTDGGASWAAITSARSLGKVIDIWADAVPYREEHSPLAAAMYTEVGGLNKWVHIWPYDDLEQRSKIRAKAVKTPSWPPPTREFLVNQENKILVPASFSPMH